VILVAEIGDVTRFATPQHLCSWCGLTPKHRESDLKTRRGRISKQGSRLVRATLIHGISRYHGGSVLDAQYRKLAKRRGRNKARVALARNVANDPIMRVTRREYMPPQPSLPAPPHPHTTRVP
jgi:transposase